MSAMRCSLCGISYPIHMRTCPVCEEPTWLDGYGDPDEWWEWRATMYQSMHQEGAATPHRQPFYLVVPVMPLIEGKVWRTPVQALYRYDDRRLLPDDGTIIETPNPDWNEDDPDTQITVLWEIYGKQHWKDQAYYLLTPTGARAIPDYVPVEWEEEFAGDEL